MFGCVTILVNMLTMAVATMVDKKPCTRLVNVVRIAKTVGKEPKLNRHILQQQQPMLFLLMEEHQVRGEKKFFF